MQRSTRVVVRNFCFKLLGRNEQPRDGGRNPIDASFDPARLRLGKSTTSEKKRVNIAQWDCVVPSLSVGALTRSRTGLLSHFAVAHLVRDT